jgi:hypothetical protein
MKNNFLDYVFYDDYIKKENYYKKTLDILNELAKEGSRACLAVFSDKIVYTSIENSFENTSNYWLRYLFFNNKFVAEIGLIDTLSAPQENNHFLYELEKLQGEKTHSDNIENSRERNNVSDIIAILSDLAGIDINEPYKAYEVMQNHADINKLKIPSKDTVAKWLKLAQKQRE